MRLLYRYPGQGWYPGLGRKKKPSAQPRGVGLRCAGHCFLLPTPKVSVQAGAMDFMNKMTDLASYAKNTAVQATTLVAGSELEKKLTEACSNEPWGASG